MFDYIGAKKEGYTDADIVEYLAPQVNFRTEDARAEGYTDTAIVKYILPKANNYETYLPPDQEPAFQTWKAVNAKDNSGADYDLRGAFEAGVKPDPKTGQLPDTFKKPNHPTFTDQSKYAEYGKPGRLDGDTYVPAGGAKPPAESEGILSTIGSGAMTGLRGAARVVAPVYNELFGVSGKELEILSRADPTFDPEGFGVRYAPGTILEKFGQGVPSAGIADARYVGQQLVDAAMYHVPAAFASAIEKREGKAGERDWKDALIERASALSEKRNANPDIPDAVKSLGPSLGFSAISMLGGLGAGLGTSAGATATGAGAFAAPALGWTAGVAASGALAYRMSTNQFTRQLYDAANADSLERTGKPISDAEWKVKQDKLEPLITEYGLFEAVPEALSQGLGLKILSSPIKAGITSIFGKSILTRFATKTAGLYGVELATETFTQQGQRNVEVEATGEGTRRSWTSASDIGDSFTEVAPSVILQTTLMGGGTKLALNLRDRIQRGGLTRKQFDVVQELNHMVETGDFDLEGARQAAIRLLDPNTYDPNLIQPRDYRSDAGAAGTEPLAAPQPTPAEREVAPSAAEIEAALTKKKADALNGSQGTAPIVERVADVNETVDDFVSAANLAAGTVSNPVTVPGYIAQGYEQVPSGSEYRTRLTKTNDDNTVNTIEVGRNGAVESDLTVLGNFTVNDAPVSVRFDNINSRLQAIEEDGNVTDLSEDANRKFLAKDPLLDILRAEDPNAAVAPVTSVETVAPVTPAETAAPAIEQNRDRGNKASVLQMQQIANAPDYGRSGVGTSLANDAPVVTGGNIPADQIGKKSIAVDTDGKRIDIQYAVVDASTVQTSNTVDGAVNPDYAGSTELRAIAGNGRVTGFREAYTRGTADNYRAEFEADTGHGISPEIIRSVPNPILVRVMSPTDITSDMGDRTNTATQLGMSPEETARNDANRVDLDALTFREDGAPTVEATRAFLRGLPPNERATLINGQVPTADATTRLNRAVFLKAYNDSALMDQLTTSEEGLTVISALTQLAPTMSRLSEAGDLDIRDIVVDAAKIVIKARNEGVPLLEAARQTDIEADPDANLVVALIAENPRGTKKIVEALRSVANFAYTEATKPETDMLGPVQRATRADVVARLRATLTPKGAQLVMPGTEAVAPPSSKAAELARLKGKQTKMSRTGQEAPGGIFTEQQGDLETRIENLRAQVDPGSIASRILSRTVAHLTAPTKASRVNLKSVLLNPEAKAGTDAQVVEAVDAAKAALASEGEATFSASKPDFNKKRMAKITGAQLYGNMRDIGIVTVKELFQNSFDAVKGALERGDISLGHITITTDSTARTITIVDDGGGMALGTISKAFLTMAGTEKDTARASGGLGIAKMLFLVGNKALRLETVRAGQVHRMNTTGIQIEDSFDDPALAPPIETRTTTAAPGTTVVVTLPETYVDTDTEEVKSIYFPANYELRNLIDSSPLFANIDVVLNGEIRPVGAKYELNGATLLTAVEFAWGTARLLVRPNKHPSLGNNFNVLSEGLNQFSLGISKDPANPYSDPVPYDFILNLEPTVKADSARYPIALNRKDFSLSGKSDMAALINYVNVLYANKSEQDSAKSFGQLTLISQSPLGSVLKRIDLNIPDAAVGSVLSIDPSDVVTVTDGRVYVNNKLTPPLTKENIKAMRRDPAQFRVDQSQIDPDDIIVHDNVLTNGKPLLEEARIALGANAVNGFLRDFGAVLQELRAAVARVGGASYASVTQVPTGLSFDLEYYGVNTSIPFKAIMLNPLVVRDKETGGPMRPGTVSRADRAGTFVGTMVHELTHHAERNHSETGFIPELARLSVQLAVSGDMATAVQNIDQILQRYDAVAEYFMERNANGNLTARGIRLEGDAERTRFQRLPERSVGPGGAGRDGADSVREGVGRGDTTGTRSQERGGSVAEGGDGAAVALPRRVLKGRVPELQDAADKVYAGLMSREEYQRLVDIYKPVRPFTSVPAMPTQLDLERGLRKDQIARIGQETNIPEGEAVGLRLDIEAYTDNNVWAPTIHKGHAEGSKPIAHAPFARITDVDFGVSSDKAIRVARGGAKSPFAKMDGFWTKTSAEDIQAMAEKFLNDPAWTQVGMDPERHEGFYDRRTQRQLAHADEVIQIGPLVLARNATSRDVNDVRYSVRSDEMSAESPSMTTAEVQQAVAGATQNLLIKTNIYGTVAEAETATGAVIPADAQGMYYGNELHLIAENVTSAADAQVVLWHEILHAGLDRLYKSGSAAYDAALVTIAARNPRVREEAAKWTKSFGADLEADAIRLGRTPDRAARHVRMRAIDEALAIMSSENVTISGLDKFIAVVQNTLRQIGLTKLADAMEGKTNAEALALISKARGALLADGSYVVTDSAPAFLRGASLQNRPLRLTGTGPNGRILNWDLGRAFTRAHKAQYGRVFNVDRPADRAEMIKSLNAEYRSQTRQPDNGEEWYVEDVARALKITRAILPELRVPSNRDLFLTMAALTSPQQKPNQNWQNAIHAMRGYIKTGRIALVKPNGTQFGVPSQTSSLQLLQHLIDTKGLAKALRWLNASHSGQEIAEVRRDSGLYETKATLSGYVASETNLTDVYLGIEMFGPKVSDFMLNATGIDPNAVTVDLWLARTYNRLLGRLTDVSPQKRKDQIIQSDLRSPTERNSIKSLIRDVAAQNGISPSAMQAALWYFEQRLYRSHGLNAPSQNFSGAASLAVGNERSRSSGNVQRAGRNEVPAVSGRGKTKKVVESIPYNAVQTTVRLNKLEDETDPVALKNGVVALARDLREQAASKPVRERSRGYDWIQERLLRAARRGEMGREQVRLGMWLLNNNPNLANDLGLSLKTAKADDASGNYNPMSRIMTLFKERGQDTLIAHEILHHAERMMPREVQDGIRAEWLSQITGMLDAAIRTNDTEMDEHLRDVLRAAGGNTTAYNRVADAIRNGTLSQDFYQYINPSEFWAVNAADIVAARASESWVQRAVQWLREFKAKIQELFGFPSNAAVIRGLDNVLNAANEGERQSPNMLSEGNTFNAVQGQPGPSLPVPSTRVEKTKDLLTYNLVDRFVDLKNLMKSIQSLAPALPESLEAYGLVERLTARVAKQVKDFGNREIDPLIKGMEARGVSVPELDNYLWMRGAPYANAIIAAQPDTEFPNFDGAGVSTTDAQAYLAALTPKQRTAFEALAKRVDAITAKTRRVWVRYGMATQDDVDKMEREQPYYAPFNREGKDIGAGSGQGVSVRGPNTFHRRGSTRPVVDVLANIIHQRDRAIVRGEKNLVSRVIYTLAKKFPSDIWSLAKPALTSAIDAETGEPVSILDMSYQKDDNVLMSIRLDKNGKMVAQGVEFNKDNDQAMRMVGALKNLDLPSLEGAYAMVAPVTRYFAALNTQYNPIFGLINLARDVSSGMLNLSTTAIAGKQFQVAKLILPVLASIYGITRAERQGSPPGTGKYAGYFERFQNAGGSTGWRDSFATSADRGKALQKELDSLSYGTAKKILPAIGGWLSDYNTAMEGSTRLAAFIVAVESGLSDAKAASIAKNLTVNFDRKGAISSQIGAWYAFFNPSVQGTVRTLQTLKGPAGKKIIAGGLLLGAVQAVFLAMAGFDDDDPPEFVRQRNFIIPIGDKKYVSFPMPLGFNILPNIGRLAMQTALRPDNIGKSVVSVLDAVLSTFNPFGSGMTAQTFAPTAADPFVAVLGNTDWTGKPIEREDFSPLDPTPGYTRAKDRATWISTMVAQGINALTGGTKYVPGLVSPTPDLIDYAVGQLTGGPGRELLNLETALEGWFSGKEVPTYKIPVAGRFYGNTGTEASTKARYYENTLTINKLENSIKGMEKNAEDSATYENANPMSKIIDDANGIKRNITNLRAQKKETGSDPASLDKDILAEMEYLNELAAQYKAPTTQQKFLRDLAP